jgi:hypothetical protein
MVGGPNAEKHEIDYEFSQYKRDGMIFEFADATDDMIRDAGGDKWLEQRDAKLKKNSEGVELMGIVPEATPVQVAAPVLETGTEAAKPATAVKPSGGEFDIKSLNGIADKMCRGIAKKAFMAAKRAGKDTTAILADVAQALSDAGKMTEDIQSILDGLSAPSPEAVTPVVETEGATKAESVAEVPPTTEVKEFDIKDLNVIEDKMARGTAKKAFLAAKRSGEDKVEAVRKALGDAGKLDVATEKLLNSFTSAAAEPSQPTAVEKTAEPTEEAEAESLAASEPAEDLPLFEIAELNGIDDKMTRGMAKKIYMAGKRADKSRTEVIADLRAGLTEAGKLDDATAAILNNLESGN